MPVISVSNKGGTSVDCSDIIAIKKQQILRASQSTKGYYKQIENKSFGLDNISNLFWKNCAGTCSTIGHNNTQLPPGTFTFKTSNDSVSFAMSCTTSQTATLTNALCNGDNTITVVPPSKGKIIVYDIDITNNNQEVTVSDLTNLQQLDCSGNQLTRLDVSRLTALQQLNCGNNQLTRLDVSRLTALQQLNCRNNQLNSLNVSDTTALQTLYCNNNSFPDQSTIDTIVGQLRDAPGENNACSILQQTNDLLTQNTNLFTTPNSVPPGWTIS